MFYELITGFFSCCRARASEENESTVIPNETSHLLPAFGPSSPGLLDELTIDFQQMDDKLGRIVRSTEGKMVSVSAVAPFIIHSAGGSTSSPRSQEFPELEIPQTPAIHIFPSEFILQVPANGSRFSILTMRPAQSRYPESHYSSTSASRSSSRDQRRSHAQAGCPTIGDDNQGSLLSNRSRRYRSPVRLKHALPVSHTLPVRGPIATTLTHKLRVSRFLGAELDYSLLITTMDSHSFTRTLCALYCSSLFPRLLTTRTVDLPHAFTVVNFRTITHWSDNVNVIHDSRVVS
ncbi:hypothetical protein C8J57DRAFT_1720796, partial [Mycena rebaudengoi]